MNALKAPSPLTPLPHAGEGNKYSPRPLMGEGAGERAKDLIITTEHLRNVDGYCVAGARAFAKLHGLDFKRFIQEGIPATDLLKTGDALALNMVEQAAQYEAGKANTGEVN